MDDLLDAKPVSFSVSSSSSSSVTRKRRRGKRQTRSIEKAGIKGEEITKTEQIVMTKEAGEEPKGIRKATETIVKIIPYKKPIVVKDTKIIEPIGTPQPAKLEKLTKVKILPKTAKTKIKILAKNTKSVPAILPVPLNKIAPKTLPTEKSLVKISFPKTKKKTYKERKLRIDF
jgi:ribosomal protein S16